jgi:hypothetical protein
MSIPNQLNKLHNKELQVVCTLPNITTVIKDDEGAGGHVAYFKEKYNTCRLLVRKLFRHAAFKTKVYMEG